MGWREWFPQDSDNAKSKSMAGAVELLLYHTAKDVARALVEALMADLSFLPCIRLCCEHDCSAEWNPVIQVEMET